jgi:hypothetical protein
VTYVHLHEGMYNGVMGSDSRILPRRESDGVLCKISKEEFQGNLQRASALCESARSFVESSGLDEDAKSRNLAKIDAWHRDLQRKISQLPPEELNRERRRYF